MNAVGIIFDAEREEKDEKKKKDYIAGISVLLTSAPIGRTPSTSLAAEQLDVAGLRFA